MSKSFLTIFLILIFANSSAQKHLSNPQLREIETLESHLIPPIIINGEMKFYSLEERMQFHKVKGLSIAVIRNGKIAWAKGYGIAEEGTNKIIDTATMFQAGSVSKPIAALTSLLVSESKHFSNQEDINQWLTSWKIPKANFKDDTISIERILSHSAGFNVHGFFGYKQGEEIPNLMQVLNGISPCNSKRIELISKPGTKWSYSGGGYEVLQQMLENVLKQPFTTIAQRFLFEKIKMNNSVFQHPLDEKKYSNFSYGHMEDGNVLEGKYRNHPELMAAGLWTTPTDLAKAINEIQNSQKGKSSVIDEALGKNILTPRLNNWGLGVVLDGEVGIRTFGHAGKNIGYTSNFFASVDKGFGIVIMTNSNMGFALMDEIFRGASYVYSWKTHNPTKKSIVKLSRMELEKYCGNYLLENSADERIMKITAATNGTLKVAQQWDNKTMIVFPEGNNAFFDMEKRLSLKYDFTNSDKITLVNKQRYYFIKKD